MEVFQSFTGWSVEDISVLAAREASSGYYYTKKCDFSLKSEH